MSKLKIATHDSATGEASHGLISLLVIPFARTQNKTIVEQYNAGCRSFDIRVRYSKKRRMWICAHGLWESVRPAEDIINEINNFPDKCEVCVTYEGTIDNKVIFDNVKLTNTFYYVPVTKSVTHNFSSSFFGNKGEEDFILMDGDGGGKMGVEDGKLVFSCGTDRTFFGSSHQYDDFILIST